MKEGRISAEQVLSDHGLEIFCPDEFVAQQRKAIGEHILYPAHNAEIEIVRADSSNLLFVKKTFGAGKKKIPLSVAQGLCDDYVLHERRLNELGIKTAENYNLRLQVDGKYGLITVQQLFFPQGTLIDWLRSGQSMGKVVVSSIRNTLMPVLKHGFVGTLGNESWVFLDNAPKNIAPVLKPNGEINVYYFDFFVPRVRSSDGSIKMYEGYNFHTRPEEEMRDRFFTTPGIIKNFLRKAYADLVDLPDVWQTFSLVVQHEMRPYLERYFPDTEIDEIVKSKYLSGANVVR